jgi:hypothetical protein
MPAIVAHEHMESYFGFVYIDGNLQQDPKLLASCDGFLTGTGIEWVIRPPAPSF